MFSFLIKNVVNISIFELFTDAVSVHSWTYGLLGALCAAVLLLGVAFVWLCIRY
jgi:hypothetical protein